ncbi:MAG TPA: substrate-binding domain-containing protein [Bryobacteraceae bacterium]|nr:substrate-binding domain-containing protein [Bryobacteraceae bacterium]
MATQDEYLQDSVLRACDILRAFRFEGEELRLRDIVVRTGINKTTAFRLLRSLEKGSLLEAGPFGRYRSKIKPIQVTQFHFGYASQGSGLMFSEELGASLARAAYKERISLISLSNGFSPRIALQNADRLIKAKVDLAIEHQTFEEVAPQIAAKFREAKIPLIALGFPHPGAVYFGANNYDGGLVGGRALGKWAKHYWQGNVKEVILLGRSMDSSFARLRVQGLERGVRETLGENGFRLVHLNGDGRFDDALRLVRRHLRFGDSGNTLVGTINDGSALGAIRAFEEAGLLQACAIVGHGGTPDGRAELRRPGTRLIGSVAYFPENYGPELIALAREMLGNKPTPKAVFSRHCLLTPGNVDHHYPNDLAFSAEDYGERTLKLTGKTTGEGERGAT